MNKQETLEESVNTFKEKHTVLNLYPSNLIQNIAELGVKWQQQRSYSEEEVLTIVKKFKNYLSFGDEIDEKKWFEQYKTPIL